jgi:hypothetical protein
MKRERLSDEILPSGWGDSSIVSTVTENRDGSITVNIQIDVDDDEGRSWQTLRKIRMPRRRPRTTPTNAETEEGD